MDNERFDEMEGEEVKSKSQLKREMAALGDLARELVDERVIDIHELPISDQIRDAVMLGKRCKRTARKRQLKHIASMLSQTDEASIRETLTRLRQPHLRQVEQEHEINAWREKLLSGDQQVFSELRSRYPDFDIQRMNQLIRNAQKEAQADKPPKYYRQIFQYLKSLHADADDGAAKT